MDNIKTIEINGKNIYIIPTAHVSKISAEEVKKTIAIIKPDSVCIELDEERYNSLNNPAKFEDTDIFKVIKENKAGYLFVNIILSSYQKRVAKNLNIQAGQEMIQAIESAKQTNANIVLVDRNIQTTFTRIYRKHSFIDKLKLISSIITSIFDNTDLKEEEIEKLKESNALESALSSVYKEFPTLANVLIHERDQVLSHKIKNAPGETIVAVLGAAHVPGVIKEIYKNQDIDELESIPPKSKTGIFIGFILAFLLVSMIIYTYLNNPHNATNQLFSWILWNGGLSALGVIIALGHPLSILTAFIAAPITSLSPLLAAGWFSGISEAFLKKPKVKDFQNITEDVSTIKGVYKNRITHILLVVILANLFSTVGTLIGGFDVIKIFFQNLLP